MNEINWVTAILVSALVGASITLGAKLVVWGYKLGFKASYEIRGAKEYSGEDKGLFKSEKDPAEFELLEEKGEK